MSARNVSLGAMFAWVPATFGLVRRNFGALALAAVLTLLVGVLIALPVLYLMFQSMGGMAPLAMGPPVVDMKGFWTAYAAFVVIGMLLAPPLLGGWYRLCESADHGGRVSALDIFRPYAEPATWMRLVGFALLGMLLYAAVLGLFGLMFKGLVGDMVAMQAAQNAALLTGHAAPPPSPQLMGKILLLYVVVLPVMYMLQFVYMVGLAEVSLRTTPVFTAFKDALLGVLRNCLKLLLFMVCIGMVAGVVVFVFALLLVLLAFVLTMFSKIAAGVLVGLLYLALLLCMYPLLFAGNYMVWKSMLGSAPSPPPVPGTMAA